jgi:hypothetical protein
MKHAHKTGLIKNKFGNARQVIQYTLKMEKIARYASTQEAHRMVGVSQVCISNVCNGKRKSAGGFFWEYESKPIILIK